MACLVAWISNKACTGPELHSWFSEDSSAAVSSSSKTAYWTHHLLRPSFMSTAAHHPILLAKTPLPWDTAFASWLLFLAPPLLSLPTQTLSLLSTYSQSALLFVILLSPLNGIRFHPSTANCLSSMAYRWTDYPHPHCLSGPASHPTSLSSSWPLQSPCLCCSSQQSNHCHQDRLILQTSAQHTYYLLLWTTLYSNPCDPIDKYVFTYCIRSPPGGQALLCPSQGLST